MKSNALIKRVSHIASRPLGTTADDVANMQSAGMILRGKPGRYGGVELTATCKINALLAAALDHPRGVPLAQSVQKVRTLQIHVARRTQNFDDTTEQGVRGAFDFLKGLSVGVLDDFGGVLDSVVADMQSGRFYEWAGADKIWLTVDIYDHGRAALFVLDRPEQRVGAYLGFGPNHEDEEGRVNLHTRIGLKVFERLAAEDST